MKTIIDYIVIYKNISYISSAFRAYINAGTNTIYRIIKDINIYNALRITVYIYSGTKITCPGVCASRIKPCNI